MHRVNSNSNSMSSYGYTSFKGPPKPRPLDPNGPSAQFPPSSLPDHNMNISGWEYHTVKIDRVPGYGFGIAISGGKDNGHYNHNGNHHQEGEDPYLDTSIIISDVIPSGPAQNKLKLNDRLISANGMSVQDVDYATAIHILRECGSSVTLMIRRESHPHPSIAPYSNEVTLNRSPKSEDFGLRLGFTLFIKGMDHPHCLPHHNALHAGDAILAINGCRLQDMTLTQAMRMLDPNQSQVKLTIHRPRKEDHYVNPLYSHTPGHPSIDTNGFGEDILNMSMNDDVFEWNQANQSTPNKYRKVTLSSSSFGPRGKHPSPPKVNGDLIEPPYGKITKNRPLNGCTPTRSGSNCNQSATNKFKDEINGSSSSSSPSMNNKRILKKDIDSDGYGYATRGKIRSSIDKGGCDSPPPSSSLLEDTSPNSIIKYPLPSSSSGTGGPSASWSKLKKVNSSMSGSEARMISFHKSGSVGIRLTGGNSVGIFVTSVQPESPAAKCGLQPGHKILKVNSIELRDVTREEAVLLLLSCQGMVHLLVKFKQTEYHNIIQQEKGDSFCIRTHFKQTVQSDGASSTSPSGAPVSLSFAAGDIFHVTDTLFNGTVGSWLVHRVNNLNQRLEQGIIPNRSRADQLQLEHDSFPGKEVNLNKKGKNKDLDNRSSFFKRRSARISKSFSRDRDRDREVTSPDISMSNASGMKYCSYERISFKHPGFMRPVIILGPLDDIAMDKLLKEYPDKYTCVKLINEGDDSPVSATSEESVQRLNTIRSIMERGKHPLLPLTMNVATIIERMNYAQFYPIVIFMQVDNKNVIKDIRSRFESIMSSSPDTSPPVMNPSLNEICKKGKSSRKLFDHHVRLFKQTNHVVTSTLTVTTAETWYKKLREQIERQQSINVWVSEEKPNQVINDAFLFPVPTPEEVAASSPSPFPSFSSLSYHSCPESDAETPTRSRSQSRTRSLLLHIQRDRSKGNKEDKNEKSAKEKNKEKDKHKNKSSKSSSSKGHDLENGPKVDLKRCNSDPSLRVEVDEHSHLLPTVQDITMSEVDGNRKEQKKCAIDSNESKADADHEEYYGCSPSVRMNRTFGSFGANHVTPNASSSKVRSSHDRNNNQSSNHHPPNGDDSGSKFGSREKPPRSSPKKGAHDHIDGQHKRNGKENKVGPNPPPRKHYLHYSKSLNGPLDKSPPSSSFPPQNITTTATATTTTNSTSTFKASKSSPKSSSFSLGSSNKGLSIKGSYPPPPPPATSTTTSPCDGPQVDRSKKPSRFRSVHNKISSFTANFTSPFRSHASTAATSASLPPPPPHVPSPPPPPPPPPAPQPQSSFFSSSKPFIPDNDTYINLTEDMGSMAIKSDPNCPPLPAPNLRDSSSDSSSSPSVPSSTSLSPYNRNNPPPPIPIANPYGSHIPSRGNNLPPPPPSLNSNSNSNPAPAPPPAPQYPPPHFASSPSSPHKSVNLKKPHPYHHLAPPPPPPPPLNHIMLRASGSPSSTLPPPPSIMMEGGAPSPPLPSPPPPPPPLLSGPVSFSDSRPPHLFPIRHSFAPHSLPPPPPRSPPHFTNGHHNGYDRPAGHPPDWNSSGHQMKSMAAASAAAAAAASHAYGSEYTNQWFSSYIKRRISQDFSLNPPPF